MGEGKREGGRELMELDFSKCKSVEDVMEVFSKNEKQLVEIGKLQKKLEDMQTKKINREILNKHIDSFEKRDEISEIIILGKEHDVTRIVFEDWNTVSSMTTEMKLARKDLPNIEKFVIFKGKKFTPPFKCLCCGIDVGDKQFCYGRTCGYCDMGSCNRGVFKYEEGHGRKDIFEEAEDYKEDED